MMLLLLLPLLLFMLLALFIIEELFRIGSICETGSDFTHSAVLITDDSNRFDAAAGAGCGTDNGVDAGGI